MKMDQAEMPASINHTCQHRLHLIKIQAHIANLTDAGKNKL
jgi:hypothetical protein